MSDPLERPVWSALTGPQAALATRLGDALRIDPDIGYFAATEMGTEASEDLGRLTRSTRRQSWLLERGAVAAPPGLTLMRTAPLTQMIALQPILDADVDEGIVALSDADADEMFALARATEPGPWESGTHRYGGYYGVRNGGRLIAMAGTRLRCEGGLAEVSGVCTDPSVRGQGLARRLTVRVLRDMVERGETPFLHCWSSNHAAIALYRTLGFEFSRELVVSVLDVA
ncbi:GNAT family N-acetyltransferase [Tsuneonella sp. HG249]